MTTEEQAQYLRFRGGSRTPVGSLMNFTSYQRVEEDECSATMEVVVCPICMTNVVPGRANYKNAGTNKYKFQLKLIKTEREAEFSEKNNDCWNSDIFLNSEHRGFGIATYAFSLLIEWGADKRPDYPVRRMNLARADAETDTMRDIRNKFYRRLGFDFCFTKGSNERSGKCSASALSQLTPHTMENIYSNESLEIAIENLEGRLNELSLKCQNLQDSNTRLREKSERYKASSNWWKTISIIIVIVSIPVIGATWVLF